MGLGFVRALVPANIIYARRHQYICVLLWDILISHAGHCNLVEDDFVDYKGILQGKTLHGIRPSHAGLCHRHCSSVFHARNVPADMNKGAHRSVVLTKDAPVLPCTYPHHVRKKWDVGIGNACGDVT